MSGEEKEIDKLRKTIEEFRAKAERCGITTEEEPPRHAAITLQESQSYSDSGIWNSPPSYPPPTLPLGRQPDALSPSHAINKRVSSGSISSMSSHASHSSMSSASSGGSNESDQKANKKKRWLPLKTFTKPARTSQVSGQVEFLEKDEPVPLLSPTAAKTSYFDNSLELNMDPRSYNEIQRILQEKDRKLTDSKLETLTLQHQLHQLQDQIAQMQHEMQLLQMENERLQACCNPTQNCKGSSEHKSSAGSLSPPSGFHCHPSTDTTFSQPINSELEKLGCIKLRRLVSPGSEDEGLQMKFTVVSTQMISTSNHQQYSEKLTIGSIPVSRKATWDELDKKTIDIFLEYCQYIDGDQKLGLTSSSISFYKVGEQTRVPGTKPPELLPCAFIVGSVNSVDISLKDASYGCADLMSFKVLISKATLSHYLKILHRRKRIILYGPSGTGKTTLAHSFANHLVAREKQSNREKLIFVYDVKQKGQEELKTQIAFFAAQYKENSKKDTIPRAIIVENCYLLTSLQETFSPLIKQTDADNVPFIIGTMLQSKKDVVSQDKNFELISCATGSIHVKNYLGRHLRRSLIESVVDGSISSDDEFQNILRVITWLPFCWHQANRCLEANNAADVTIGPRVLASCPIDFFTSCSWFVQVWNYVITPYVTVAIQNVRQSRTYDPNPTPGWVDPTEWVVESFPWNPSDMGCDNSLRLKRIGGDDLEAKPAFEKNASNSSAKNSPAKQFKNSYNSDTVCAADLKRAGKDGLSTKDGSRIQEKMSTESQTRFYTERCNDVSLHPMKLIELRNERKCDEVWHRLNDG